MPHCVIEYSSGLEKVIDMSQLMIKLQFVIVASQLFDPSAVKLRAIKYQDYMIAHDLQHFLHVSLKILSGRSQDKKILLSKQMLEVVRQLAPMTGVASTVEIHDMDPELYQK